MKKFRIVAFVACLLASGLVFASELTIDFWYGKDQRFGQVGHPQRWVNLLGNASPASSIASATWTLNNSNPRKFTIGDSHARLAQAGDFNIEIDRSELKPGLNTVRVRVDGKDGESEEETVRVVYTGNGRRWPLPYAIDWQSANRIEDVAQVVDGEWAITDEGIRTIGTGYDRILAFGDDSWRDYEVSTTVTFHAFTPGMTGANKTKVSHAAIGLRWPGHDTDKRQPHIKWFPLGATGEFTLSEDLKQCHWRIYDRPVKKRSFVGNLLDAVFGEDEPLFIESTKRREIELDRAYGIKHRVTTLADGRTRYSVKLWPANQPEPEGWDLVRTESDDLSSGSALLVAHHTDVTFGDVMVTPIGI